MNFALTNGSLYNFSRDNELHKQSALFPVLCAEYLQKGVLETYLASGTDERLAITQNLSNWQGSSDPFLKIIQHQACVFEIVTDLS